MISGIIITVLFVGLVVTALAYQNVSSENFHLRSRLEKSSAKNTKLNNAFGKLQSTHIKIGKRLDEEIAAIQKLGNWIAKLDPRLGKLFAAINLHPTIAAMRVLDAQFKVGDSQAKQIAEQKNFIEQLQQAIRMNANAMTPYYQAENLLNEYFAIDELPDKKRLTKKVIERRLDIMEQVKKLVTEPRPDVSYAQVGQDVQAKTAVDVPLTAGSGLRQPGVEYGTDGFPKLNESVAGASIPTPYGLCADCGQEHSWPATTPSTPKKQTIN
jgi:cell division protein FtsL